MTRRGRRPSLSDYDLTGSVDPDNYQMGSGARVWPPKPGGAKQNLRTISGDGCWCGQPYGHDWPGRADGAPHPSERQQP